MSAIGLDHIEAAYIRLQRSIIRGLEDAVDFSGDVQFDALVMDQDILDAAFFVLIFGQLERRITDLALRKIEREDKQNALRDQKFDRRLSMALPDEAQRQLRTDIEAWYSARTAPAHGSGIGRYDIPTILEAARALDAMLAQINQA